MLYGPISQNQVPDIVLIGHIVKEMIYFPGRTLGPVLGSPVAYGSVLGACLGEKVGIVSTVGTDMPIGLLQPFRDAGVDMRGLLVREGNWTTASELIYYESGDKEIRYPQRAPPVCFEDIPLLYHAARIFYVATMDHDVPLESIKRMRSLAGLTAIDLGGYGGAHSQQHPDETERSNAVHLRTLVSYFDVVRASVEDCRHLLGKHRLETQEDEEAVVRLFVTWGAKVGLMTLGERGCLVNCGGDSFRVPAQRGRVIDTTGAGDAFSTAFLIGYMHSDDVAWSARFAAAAVIYMIQRTGGVRVERMPDRHEVDKLLASGSRGCLNNPDQEDSP